MPDAWQRLPGVESGTEGTTGFRSWGIESFRGKAGLGVVHRYFRALSDLGISAPSRFRVEDSVLWGDGGLHRKVLWRSHSANPKP